MPHKINFGMLFLLAILMIFIISMSTNVKSRYDKPYNGAVYTCIIILITYMYYVTITFVQYIIFVIVNFFKNKRNTEYVITPVPKYRTTFNSYLLTTIDFHGIFTEQIIFVSREEIWRIFYPITWAVFFTLVAVPIYEYESTASLCAGFVAKGIHDEIYRGFFWGRSNKRKFILLFVGFSGFAACCLLFSISYSFQTKYAIADISQKHTIQAVAQNSSFNYTTYPVAQNSSFNYTTYPNEVTSNSYKFRSLSSWICTAIAPFVLAKLPESIQLPVIFEIFLPSLACISTFVLCVVATSTNTIPLELFDTISYVECIFFLMAPFFVFGVLFVVVYAVQRKKTMSIASVVILIFIIKIIFKHQFEIQQTLVITTCVCCCIFTISNVVFDREENIAIRSGWGEDSDIPDTFDIETEIQRQRLHTNETAEDSDTEISKSTQQINSR